MIPQTRYAMVGELEIAYQVIGEGPPDLMWSMGSANHVDEAWEDPSMAVFFRRVAGFSRLIRFDVLGAGASDRLAPGVDPPAFSDQLDAVCAAAETERFAVLAAADLGPGAIQYVVNNPERVTHLILVTTTACFKRKPDYPIGLADEQLRSLLDMFEQIWGTDAMIQALAPDRADDPHFVASTSKYFRSVGTPREMRRQFERNFDMDVRHLLDQVEAPTLVIYQENPLFPESHSEYLIEEIPDVSYIKLPGFGGTLADSSDLVLPQIEGFITDSTTPSSPQKSLKALLFTDIVESTSNLEKLGDRDWSAVLDIHDEISARCVGQHGGSVVKSTGDGILAMFSNPDDAIRASQAMREELARMSIDIRSGVHFGEVQKTQKDLLGVAVHITARIMDRADSGEILVSRTVRDLTAGSIQGLVDAGTHELKGISEPWQLYRLANDQEA